jgi:ketosteroid isomerase-like protein
MLISTCMIFPHSLLLAQKTEAKPESATIDIQKARAIIESIDKQFAQDYFNGDSIALAAHYTNDAQFGCLKGKEILSYWGRSIRNSIKNNTRNLAFTTTTLTADSDFLIEVGVYEIKDEQNNLRSKGKYLVVWKQENGDWKLYRDIGL